MKKITVVRGMYFSGTGTTEKIVKKLTETLAALGNWETAYTDFTLPAARKEVFHGSDEELVVFGVPVYAGRVPNVLLKYLASLEGNNSLAVPVVLYGNRNFDDALIELAGILENQGFHTIAGGAFIGEHSFSEILAAGRPDQADEAKAVDFAQKIYHKIAVSSEEELYVPVKVKGETPIRPYYQPRDRQGNPVNILKVKPLVNKELCDNCGICVQVCPMGSISAEDVSVYQGICIKCGACIKKCPNKARFYEDEGYLYHKKELELGYARRAEPEIFT